MLPFLSGFILAVILVVPSLVLFYRRYRMRLHNSDAMPQRRLEELAKLTGGLAHEIKNPLSTIKVNLKLIAEEAPPAHQDSPRWLRKIDVVQKELMTIALSVAVQCKSCLEIHLEKARGMGIGPEEIEEAAWMGVVFGGCRSMMFWQEESILDKWGT